MVLWVAISTLMFLLNGDLQHEKNGEWNLINSLKISVVSYGYEVSKDDEKGSITNCMGSRI